MNNINFFYLFFSFYVSKKHKKLLNFVVYSFHWNNNKYKLIDDNKIKQIYAIYS